MVRRILELACRAPSVHNTQPWLWGVRGARIDLFADRRRQLPVSDRSGRNLTISCGAAVHHLGVAAAALALEARITRMPVPNDPRHLATVQLTAGRHSPRAVRELQALERRVTDRRRFTSWPIPDERLANLARAAGGHGVHCTPVVDVSERLRLELLISRAMTRQNGDPRLAEEQLRWVDHGGVDGVPAAVAVSAIGYSRPRPSRFTHTGPGDLDDLVQGSDGLIVMSTDDDTPQAWLRAGEALSALWLRATLEGLSVVPLSQVVEVDETRGSLHHDLLGGQAHPQILLRIGWQPISRSEQVRTPRRALDDMLMP